MKMKTKTIAGVRTFEAPARGREPEADHERRLAELAQQWDRIIRQELSGLAELLWSDEFLLGVIPIHHYRVRYQSSPQLHVWWVEHDIPPANQYRYAAYRVLLTMDSEANPRLTVQSGEGVYSVTPLKLTALKEALAEAGGDDPLIIPRPTAETRH
jgi:hypothetical protein